MTLEEIYALPVTNRIAELKRRKTALPNASELNKDWDEKQHEVFDLEVRKKRKVMVEEEETDDRGKVTKPARYEQVDVNRIALPLEQDIVNIHTAFTVGIEPTLKPKTEDENTKSIVEIIRSIYRQNKIKFVNKRAVRSWLSEQEVAEYWYTQEDSTWWRKVLNTIISLTGTTTTPTYKLKVAVWSPFRGDKLYPYFDEYGDLIAFSREYTVKDNDGMNEVTKLMTIDHQKVTIFNSLQNTIEREFPHNFKKLPVIYMYRPNAFCEKIKPIRKRLETLLSNFADCLDFNFFPKLAAKGAIENVIGRNTGSEVIVLENGAEIAYLTWQQSPDMAKLEFENLTERAYSLTNTPRISFENLKGAGAGFSGVSFRYAFMGTHMAVSNHAEDVEEYLQRRVNFMISAIGTIYPKLADASKQAEIMTEIVPYMIDNQSDNIKSAVAAVQGGIASKETGILLAGLTDKLAEELELIKEDEKLAAENAAAGVDKTPMQKKPKEVALN